MILMYLLEAIFKRFFASSIATLHFIAGQRSGPSMKIQNKTHAGSVYVYAYILTYHINYLSLPIELTTMEKNSVIKHKICKGLSHLDHFTQPKSKSYK